MTRLLTMSEKAEVLKMGYSKICMNRDRQGREGSDHDAARVPQSPVARPIRKQSKPFTNATKPTAGAVRSCQMSQLRRMRWERQ